MKIGGRIKNLRAQSGQTAQQVADEIGVTRSAVSLWETDQTLPTPDNLVALSRHFNVSVDELLGEDGRAA